MSRLHFRQATKEDVPLIVSLDQKIFGVYGGEEDPDIIAARVDAYPKGCRMLELVNGETVGYLTVEKWTTLREPALNENPHETHDPNGSVLNITTLAIDPPYQSQGFGGEVLQWLEPFSIDESCNQIVLETANARSFYEKHGYHLMSERNERGYPLYVMVKTLRHDNAHFVTQAIHGGRDPNSTAVPIYQGVNAPRTTGITDYVSDFGGSGGPTIVALENLMADIEGGQWSVAASTGTGAISLLFMALLNHGDRIVAHKCIYSIATRFLNEELAYKMNLTIDWIDMRDLDAVREALATPAKLVYFEPIANPSMHHLDVSSITQIAHEAGSIVAVDNTLLSPYLLRPLSLGVDVVLHSATKYLGGHGDALAGVISGNRDDLKEKIMRMRTFLGLFLAPMTAYLIIRGIRTLPFRMKRHCENAHEMARFFEQQPLVKAVRFPGLTNNDASKLVNTQQSDFGALIGLILDEKINPREFRQKLELCRPWGSLGDVETLVSVPTSSEFRDVPNNYLRVAVGLENVADIQADFQKVFDEYGR